jgi:hypothetical protein
LSLIPDGGSAPRVKPSPDSSPPPLESAFFFAANRKLFLTGRFFHNSPKTSWQILRKAGFASTQLQAIVDFKSS